MFVILDGGSANFRKPLSGRRIDRFDQGAGLLFTPAANPGPGARVEGAQPQGVQRIGGLVHDGTGMLVGGGILP